jgi:hypothetical protein
VSCQAASKRESPAAGGASIIRLKRYSTHAAQAAFVQPSAAILWRTGDLPAGPSFNCETTNWK